MISWIIATNNMQRLAKNHEALLQDDMYVDQLVIVENADSITKAYTEGQRRAIRPVKVFIHDDVQILDLPRLRDELIHATEQAHLVGVIGSRTPAMPWWHSPSLLGSVVDRGRVLDYGPGGECAMLDGLLLASRYDLPWDIHWSGWHGYDVDVCRSVAAAGGTVYCVTGGKHLLHHRSDSPFSLEAVDGWSEATARYQEKWGCNRNDT